MKKILGLSVAALLVIAMVGGGTWAFFQDTESSTANTLLAGTLDLTLDDTNVATFEIDGDEVYPGANNSSDIDYFIIKNIGSITGSLDIAIDNVINVESTAGTEYENDAIGGATVTGTATGGSATTLVHSEAGWGINAYAGRAVEITGGDTRYIISNTEDTLTLNEGEGIVSGDAYRISKGELGEATTFRVWLDIEGNGGSDFDDGTDILFVLNASNQPATTTASAEYNQEGTPTYAAWYAINAFNDKTWEDVLDMAENAEHDLVVEWRIANSGDNTDNQFQGDSVIFDMEFVLTQAD